MEGAVWRMCAAARCSMEDGVWRMQLEGAVWRMQHKSGIAEVGASCMNRGNPKATWFHTVDAWKATLAQNGTLRRAQING